MPDIFSHLALGFSVALSVKNLGLCLIGVLVGTLVGVLPGLGPLAVISMLLPLTFGLPPAGALIMLAGIYYGAQYGGSTTSILLNIPGEASSVMTTLDGYQMARKGRAGAALAIAALGSFFAGCAATVLVAALAIPITKIALSFGPWEYFSLTVLAFAFTVTVTDEQRLKSIAMVVLGVLLSTVGTDQESGTERMTLGLLELSDGIGFLVVAMGIFGFAEILKVLSAPQRAVSQVRRVGGLMPTHEEASQSAMPVVRGTAIGSLFGILPGGGAIIASFAAYLFEKWWAKDPSRFGKGAIEGVAAPESANNAAAQTSFIPLLTLGIPSNAIMALMAGAMSIHGIAPGPLVMTKQPGLFWGVVVSMWVGNLLLLIINLPLVGVWMWILKLPYRHLFPLVVLFCCIGLYASGSAREDVLMAGVFGLLGYWLMRNAYEPAPLLLGLILGPIMEENLRRAVTLSSGDLSLFLLRPISGSFLVCAALLLCAVPLGKIRVSNNLA